jgi:hypothetical protein
MIASLGPILPGLDMKGLPVGCVPFMSGFVLARVHTSGVLVHVSRDLSYPQRPSVASGGDTRSIRGPDHGRDRTQMSPHRPRGSFPEMVSATTPTMRAR